MSKLTHEQVCAAIPRAVEAMRANPDKIARGSLAENEGGDSVSVLSSEAVCWCALGFLAKELGVDSRTTIDFKLQLNREARIDVLKVSEVYVANDQGVYRGDPLAAIPALEALCRS